MDRPAAAPSSQSLLRGYGYLELAIGVIGLGISALLLNLDHVSALVSSYLRDASGWYVLSTTSHMAHLGIAVILLTPITLLMGGTLTLLIRHLVRSDVELGGWRIAVLYGVNTGGAALGCVLTDFALVPSWGLLGTQAAAALFNVVAGIGALCLAAWKRSPAQPAVRLKADRSNRPRPRPHLRQVCAHPPLRSPVSRSLFRASRRWTWKSCGSATSASCSATSARCSRCCSP